MHARAAEWQLDPGVVFLNHGSFGATPRAVLATAREIQARFESEPVRFVMNELEAGLDGVRLALAPFVGAQAEDLAFVSNATAGVNTVLRSLAFAPGDEIVITNHGYNACNNAARYVAERAGASVVVADLPFPVASDEELVAALLAVVTRRTRLAIVDQVTSPTALVMPLRRIVAELAARGVETLVDGAHGPGMVPVDVDALGAEYYTANLHKWVCAPKGAAFLHVRRDRQASIRPLSISHGANSTRTDRSRFRVEFDWTGTFDPSAVLTVPVALSTLAGLVPGGWPEVRRKNHELAVAARRLCAEALGIDEPCPPELIGSMFALPLPRDGVSPPTRHGLDPLCDRLFERYAVEVPVMPWPAPPRRLVRPCAQLYNDLADYRRLADALLAEGAA